MSAVKHLAGITMALLVLAAPLCRASDPDDIKKAIDRGVAFLKFNLRDSETLHVDHKMGVAALVALALLECDLDAGDPVMQKAIALIRQASIEETQTYDISLAIMFLDRLGDKQDDPIIEALTNRLAGGQNLAGGWSYNCPLDRTEARRLDATLRTQENSKPGGKGPQARPGNPEARRPGPELPIGSDAIPVQQNPLGSGLSPVRAGFADGEGDNSNTQFATLALWVARRHKLKTDAPLAAVEQRFRAMQKADGSWSYMSGSLTTPAMTCAGLIGLAVAYGVANETLRSAPNRAKEENETPRSGTAKPRGPRDPNRDPNVRAGLVALGRLISGPFAGALRWAARNVPPVPVIPDAKAPLPGAQPRPLAGFAPPGAGFEAGDGADYYLLWSVERVGMAYGLKTIGNVDWYEWGAKLLLARQQQNGSWRGGTYDARVDTSFALLFLRRSNLASDLTAALKGKVQDPLEVKLRSGGIGGDQLRSRDAKIGQPDPGKTPEESTGSIPKLKLDGGNRGKPAGARAGSTSPPATSPRAETEADRLSNDLVNAPADRQKALIEKLRDSKGGVHTEALALAIPQLTGAAHQKAREALVRRLMRMTADTLRDKLADEDAEIRRAAALACAMKEEKSFVPDLIKLLDDAEQPVARAAHAALKALTRQDFGPEDAGQEERGRAIAQWKEWWAKNK